MWAPVSWILAAAFHLRTFFTIKWLQTVQLRGTNCFTVRGNKGECEICKWKLQSNQHFYANQTYRPHPQIRAQWAHQQVEHSLTTKCLRTKLHCHKTTEIAAHNTSLFLLSKPQVSIMHAHLKEEVLIKEYSCIVTSHHVLLLCFSLVCVFFCVLTSPLLSDPPTSCLVCFHQSWLSALP